MSKTTLPAKFNQTAANANSPALGHPAKAVYFATGAPEMALRDIARLGLSSNGTALRVVSPLAGCAQLAQHPGLKKTPVIAYTPGRALWVWLQLLSFLGFTRKAELICLNTPQTYRLLKLLAFSLRGRGRFSTGEGQTPEVSVFGMLRLSWHNYWIRHERRVRAMPMLVIGSGSARSLCLIASRLRRRHPAQRFVAWLPASLARDLAHDLEGIFDETVVVRERFISYLGAAARLLRQCRQFRAAIIPCTNEFNRWMKLFALLAPLRQKEIHNEVGDSFKLADLRSGMRHLQWRFLGTRRKLAWPVAVMGSASGYYLEKIVASIRRSFPGSEVHGWLGPMQARSAGHLFDVVHSLPSTEFSATAVARLIKHGRRYRSWIVPCTDEPFRALQLLAFCIPLPSRRLYNETGDGFPLREVATLWRHICWRLRYKFTFQFLSGSTDRTFLRRLMHVPAYALRLAAAAPQLIRATRNWDGAGTRRATPPTTRVDVLASSSEETRASLAIALSAPGPIEMNVMDLPDAPNLFDLVWRAAQSSKAEYLCILDGQCNLEARGWLENLLAAFDETVAQVGPELRVPGRDEVYQGAIFDGAGGLLWNTNSAARFHGRQQWLEVGALPWVCLVIRRQALLRVAPHCARPRPSSEWILAELCQQFASHGWLSICTTEVAASHPLRALAEKLHLSTAT